MLKREEVIEIANQVFMEANNVTCNQCMTFAQAIYRRAIEDAMSAINDDYAESYQALRKLGEVE